MLRILRIFLPLLIVVTLFSSAKAIENNVTVGMTVESRISKSNSSISYSADETLSDPENHPIVVLIKLRDAGGVELSGLTVQISSSRGSIDIIEMFSDDGQNLLPVNIGTTNALGEIKFRLGSYIPGDAVFSIVADSVVAFEDKTIKFLPLPFPGNVEVSVPLPPDGAKKIVLIPKAPDSAASTTPAREQAKRSANVGTEISIPFSLFLISTLLLFASPILLIISIIYLMRLRKHQQKEEELLDVILQAEHVDEVKHFVGRTT